MILHGIEYQRPTSLNMPIMADHVTYSFLAFMKSIFHFCLGCYCGGYSQNGRSNLSSCENFKLKICMCNQSMTLGTHTKLQLEILMSSMISAIHKFRENILEGSQNVSETPPGLKSLAGIYLWKQGLLWIRLQSPHSPGSPVVCDCL